VRDDITLGLAVLASALGAWNFWKSHWGTTPRYAVAVEHRAGNEFVLRSVGRKDFVARFAQLKPAGHSDLPEIFDVRRDTAVPFRLTLFPSDVYPATLKVSILGKPFKEHVADFPFSPEAQEAAQWQQTQDPGGMEPS
jgi:hypothetical protein